MYMNAAARAAWCYATKSKNMRSVRVTHLRRARRHIFCSEMT